MEDLLEVYKEPYDPLRPVVCMDETNRHLIGEVAPPIPMAVGRLQIYDFEYVRNGIVCIFMMFEPLAARRYTAVTNTRTKINFAYFLRDLSDNSGLPKNSDFRQITEKNTRIAILVCPMICRETCLYKSTHKP